MIVIGVAVIGFLAVLLFGLFTGRIAWRQQGCCCPADPANDARMRGHEEASTSTITSSVTKSREP